MTKPVTTVGLWDSPHLLWSPWKQGQEHSCTWQPWIERHKGREQHASCYWHFTDSHPDVFTPPGFKVLSVCYKSELAFFTHTWCLPSSVVCHLHFLNKSTVWLEYVRHNRVCAASQFNPFIPSSIWLSQDCLVSAGNYVLKQEMDSIKWHNGTVTLPPGASVNCYKHNGTLIVKLYSHKSKRIILLSSQGKQWVHYKKKKNR